MIIYFHGLNSSIDSNKFKILQSVYEDIKCFEWSPNDSIKDRLNKLSLDLSKYKNVTLIGDSTGANFAYQVREQLKSLTNVKLILTSPLLSLKQMDENFFLYSYVTDTLRKNIIDIKYIDDAFIIKPIHDEVLPHKYECKINCDVLNIDSTHRIDDFKDYIDYIKDYLK